MSTLSEQSERSTLTGLERLRALARPDTVQSPSHALLGMSLELSGDGDARACAELSPAWLRPDGTLDPGVLIMLGDAGFGSVALGTLRAGEANTTGTLRIDVVPGRRPRGLAAACGRLVGRDGNVVLVTGDIHDADGTVLAHLAVRSHVVPLRGAAVLDSGGAAIRGTSFDDVLVVEAMASGPEELHWSWTPDPRTANRHGQVHGGFLGALTERAAAAVCGQDRGVTLLDHSINYFRPVRADHLASYHVVARLERAGRQVVGASVRLLDADRRLVAMATGSYLAVGSGG